MYRYIEWASSWASIDEHPQPPDADIVSQLYPTSLSTIADPVLAASYLRWRVLISFAKVRPDVFTKHKTSNRLPYERARALLEVQPQNIVRDGVPMQSEILIINEDWEIMEGYRFTPYFKRGNEWITPAAECGGNFGTTRRW